MASLKKNPALQRENNANSAKFGRTKIVRRKSPQKHPGNFVHDDLVRRFSTR
jgi:hypothetical protein